MARPAIGVVRYADCLAEMPGEPCRTLILTLAVIVIEVAQISSIMRLFMHAAEQLDHLWLSRLDLSNIDFGSGRRTIHAGGRLDKKYNLVVADPVQG
jgi:hypothetical protein